MGIIENPLKNINVNTQQDNFISACMSGVDPRNGVFNHSTTILDYKSAISDVSFSFVLNYNSKSIYTNQGYGYGFTDNLSRYDKERRVLTLSSGQVYSIASDNADEQPSLVDYHFENFTFTKEKIQSLHGAIYIYIIKYIDGNVEKLENRDLKGVEQNCYVPSVIYFGMSSEIIMQWDYLNGVPYLQSVIEKKTDIFSNKYLLAFTRIDENQRRIRVFEDELYGYDVFLKNDEKNLLVQIKNYGFDISGKYNWDFKYSNKEGKGRLLNEITYPCGRKDKVEYLRANDRFDLSLPKKLRLYRVRRYYITPQFIAGIKKLVTQYTFSSVGKDKCYSSVEEYMDIRFSVIKKISRTYNKFHLLISETTEVGLSTTEVFYTYEACDENKELSQQPLNYQCINEIKTTLTDLAIAKNNKRYEVINMSYDEKGNLTRQVNNNGVIIFFSYTDKVNHAGVLVNIPNDIGLIKSIEIMYLKDIGNNLVKEYDYELIINAASSLAKNGGNSTYKLVPISEKTLINNILVKSTSFEYFKGIHDRISVGRLKSSSIKCYDRLTVKRFSWSGEDYKSEMTLNIETEVQGVIIDEVLVWNAVTGLVKSIVDSLYRKYEYIRDKIGRVTIAKITSNIYDEVRSKTFQYNYEYKVDDISGVLYYEKKTIDFHKDKIYERYDGLGRLQCVAMSKSDSDEEKILHAYKYDDLSRLDYEEHFSYKDDERFSFISLYSYDDWGYIKTIKHNDGVEENIVTDLINRTKAHWLACGKEITNETLIIFDINNEPVSYRRYHSNGEFLQIMLERDFCGRLVKCHDELGNVTQYEYDLFDRVNKIIFPDNSVINKDYSKYSEEPLIEKITFKSSDGQNYNIGTQTFDDLNRLVESQSYGVITKNVYSLHYPLPDKVFFADGTVHIYNNDYSLQNNILSVVDDQRKFFKTFKYSEVDGSLIESKFLTPRDIFIEKINEDTKKSCLEINTKFIHDGRSIDLTYRQEDYYNNEGIYKITDETNAEYLYSRDSYGRITGFRSDKIRTEVLYDIFSRIFQVDEYDGNSKTVIQYAYDEFSREISRKVYLFFDSENTNKQPDLIIAVNTSFYKNNLIKSRSIEQYHEDTKTDIRKEVFAYDIMNRIIFYECEGSSPIKGENKKGIKSIGYSYDEVGNISIADTVYEDDSRARLNFYYDENKPFLLSWMQDESTLEITQNEFNSLGFLISKTHTQRINADFSKKLNVDFTYNKFFHLASTKNTTSGTNFDIESKNIVYRYGTSDKLFFRKSVTKTVKEEEIFTHRGYGDEIINLIDFRDEKKFKKINSLYGGTKKIVQKTDEHSINSTIITNNSGSPIYVVKYWDGRYESSAYSAISVYGVTKEKNIKPALNGCLYDSETDGYLLGARLYDPHSMRFTTPDSLSPFCGGNINPYIFCNNNPVNNNDNTGYMTRESWRGIVYGGAALSIATGIVTLGCSIAMSSILVSIVAIMQITGGVITISKVKKYDDSDLAIQGVYTLLDIGLSLFSMAKILRVPLSKNLNRVFDFNRSLQSTRTIPVNQNRKKYPG